jgi:hypothetical protein
VELSPPGHRAIVREWSKANIAAVDVRGRVGVDVICSGYVLGPEAEGFEDGVVVRPNPAR